MKIIIAAIASRPYVQAAVAAGFDVVAIDSFVDADTKHLAQQCYPIDSLDNQLDSKQLIRLLDDLDLQQFSGFCYGAGFEKSPDILTEIDKRISVLGNTASVVEKCKGVDHFFRLCDELNVPHPPVMTKRPLHTQGWLQKEIGGSGGGHIKHLAAKQKNQIDDFYYQKVQTGKSISCLFLANGYSVQLIGFNEQWLDDNVAEPFRYGGAVSHADVSEEAKAHLTGYVRQLTQAIGLVGLNSCDVMVDGDDVYVLEINPRLSATIDLYATESANLMTVHVAANKSNPDVNLTKLDNACDTSNAHQVIYARQDVFVKQDMEWPFWVSDIPTSGSRFGAGMPICTVKAEGETPLLAQSLVRDRAVALNKQFLN